MTLDRGWLELEQARIFKRFHLTLNQGWCTWNLSGQGLLKGLLLEIVEISSTGRGDSKESVCRVDVKFKFQKELLGTLTNHSNHSKVLLFMWTSEILMFILLLVLFCRRMAAYFAVKSGNDRRAKREAFDKVFARFDHNHNGETFQRRHRF